MRWRRVSQSVRVSECGRYELRSEFRDGCFAWRGRFKQTDELVAASQDRAYVSIRCESHAARVAAEAEFLTVRI